MGTSPFAKLRCDRCGDEQSLPRYRAPSYYLLSDAASSATTTAKSSVKIAMPRCLGECQSCYQSHGQRFVDVEDFSENLASLRQRFWAVERAFTALQVLPKWRAWQRWLPSRQQKLAALLSAQQQLSVLLMVRLTPGRKACCLACGSAEITPYPDWRYDADGCLTPSTDVITHSCCGGSYHWHWVAFHREATVDGDLASAFLASSYYGRSPRYFNLAGQSQSELLYENNT